MSTTKSVFKIPPEGLPSFTSDAGVTTGQGRIEHRLFKRDQSWCYEAIWAICGRRVRVMVTRNSHDAQSFMKAQVFNDDATEWKFLCEIPFGPTANCFGARWTADVTDQSRFEQDADAVLEKACRILNPFYANRVAEAEAAQGTKKVLHVQLISRITFSDGTTSDHVVR